jgi:hypothetical protein
MMRCRVGEELRAVGELENKYLKHGTREDEEGGGDVVVQGELDPGNRMRKNKAIRRWKQICLLHQKRKRRMQRMDDAARTIGSCRPACRSS